MAKPKRDYTIEDLPGSPTAHIHLNDLSGELMAKILRMGGIRHCFAYPASSLLAIEFSPNYDRVELLTELEALLAAYFAPIPAAFDDEFDELLKP